MMNRRDLVGAAAAAAAVAAGSAAAKPAAKPTPMAKTAHSAGMPLSLSTITVEGDRTPTSISSKLTFPEFLTLAKTLGYDGVHIRASLAGIFTPLDKLYEMRRQLKESGLRCSSVCSDFDVPINNDRAALCLRNITPYLDVAEIFDTDMVRIGMKKQEDIVWAQRASDEARERKLKLVHHAEARTLFATFDLAYATLKAVNRPNFGLQQDESQWMCNTKDYKPELIGEHLKRVAPWTWEVFMKNQPGGPGPEQRPEIPMAQKGGVDFDRLFDALYAINYKGFIQLHEKGESYGGDVRLAAAKGYEFLKPYASRGAKA